MALRESRRWSVAFGVVDVVAWQRGEIDRESPPRAEGGDEGHPATTLHPPRLYQPRCQRSLSLCYRRRGAPLLSAGSLFSALRNANVYTIPAWVMTMRDFHWDPLNFEERCASEKAFIQFGERAENFSIFLR